MSNPIIPTATALTAPTITARTELTRRTIFLPRPIGRGNPGDELVLELPADVLGPVTRIDLYTGQPPRADVFQERLAVTLERSGHPTRFAGRMLAPLDLDHAWGLAWRSLDVANDGCGAQWLVVLAVEQEAGEAKGLAKPDGDPELPDEIRDAIQDYGDARYADGLADAGGPNGGDPAAGVALGALRAAIATAIDRAAGR